MTRGRVLHFIDTVGPGGAETVFLNVADGMRQRGWEGRTVLIGPGWVLDRVQQLGLAVDVVPTRGRMDWRFLRNLSSIVRRHEVDLIHVHLFSPAVYASAVGRWTGVPVIATLHGASDTETDTWGRRLRLRFIVSSATVVAVSGSLRDSLTGSTGLEPGDTYVIHNGVDPRAYAAADGRALRHGHGVPDDAILVGALGNIRPAKDYPNFLRAAARLAGNRRMTFAIAGERTQPLYGDLIALRDSLGLRDRVSFWGFQDDPAPVLSAFDVLVISSKSEGFSLAAIEGMATGTPVVATRSGGPAEIITDGEDGLLVPVESPEALARQVRAVVDDQALRDRLTTGARRTLARRFSLTAMLDQYEQIYATVAADAGR